MGTEKCVRRYFKLHLGPDFWCALDEAPLRGLGG